MKNYNIESKITEDEFKRNMAIAVRFLKDTKLFQHFKNYLNSSMHASVVYYNNHSQNRHWADYDKITKIFRKTMFTTYLRHKGLTLKNDIRIYEVFAAYVHAFYPSIKVNYVSVKAGSFALKVDKEKKTAKIDFIKVR